MLNITKQHVLASGLGLWLFATVVFNYTACTNTKKNNQSPAHSPWLNHNPEVSYIGSGACVQCHAQICEDYKQTGMGRSWYPVKPHEKIEDFSPKTVVYDKYSDYYYRPFWQKDSMYILEYRLNGRDTIHRRREVVNYVVGSGNQTRSYILERHGYLYLAPITWYVAKKIWDLSPGYENGNNTRFSREIGQECMHCHNGVSEFIPGSINRYQKIAHGIDCERCHGPAEEHVRRMEAANFTDTVKGADYSIINPKRLSIGLQFDVCQQCHLQGIKAQASSTSLTDFRPGMPLTKLHDVFLIEEQDPTRFGIASQAERLRKSKCFITSNLSCTPCHNPHKSFKTTAEATYRKACLNCHTAPQTECREILSIRQARQDQCPSCHMPKGGTSDIPHVSFTDHFIRVVQPKQTPAKPSFAATKTMVKLLCATSAQPSPRAFGLAYLNYYEKHEPIPDLLDLALQYLPDTCYYEKGKVLYYKGEFQRAINFIQKAQQHQSNDAWVYHLAGDCFDKLGFAQQSAEAYLAAYNLNPNLTLSGIKYVGKLLQTNPTAEHLRQAEQLLLKLKTTKPFDEQILTNLAVIYMNTNRPALAQSHLTEALRLNPDYKPALENAIVYYVFNKDKLQARIYFERLVRKHPQTESIAKLRRLVD